MNSILKYISCASIAAAGFMAGGCTEDSPVTNPPVEPTPEIVIDRSGIALGADVSWLTQLEYEGEKFYAPDGTQMECMQLLRDHCGVNSIRLRVWVNPEDGWNNIHDVLVKARRANALGLRLMIDFHFSDTWADPGHQETPAAWASLDLNGLKAAVSEHVTEMMTLLKQYNIEPEWVQIGNETRGGFMYPLGSIDEPANFTALVNAGNDAVKAIFPEAKTIVHLDSGDNIWYYNRIFGALQSNGGNYDMIGMSLYPEALTWQSLVSSMLDNVATLYATYGKPVMLCEIGMSYDEADACNAAIAEILSKASSLPLEGVFYWEPEAPAGYNDGYNKGCFVNGTPTSALDPFKNY